MHALQAARVACSRGGPHWLHMDPSILCGDQVLTVRHGLCWEPGLAQAWCSNEAFVRGCSSVTCLHHAGPALGHVGAPTPGPTLGLFWQLTVACPCSSQARLSLEIKAMSLIQYFCFLHALGGQSALFLSELTRGQHWCTPTRQKVTQRRCYQCLPLRSYCLVVVKVGNPSMCSLVWQKPILEILENHSCWWCHLLAK